MSLSERWNAALDSLRKLDRFRSFRRPAGVDFTSNDYLGYGNGRLLPPPGMGEGWGGGRLSGEVSTPHPNPPPQGGRGPEWPGEGLPSPLSRSGIASRLLRGHHEIWERVESELAAWHGCETTLMMTSGYTANEGLLSTICEPGDWVAYDELSHACIAEGLRLAKCRRFSFRHNDVGHLEDALKAEAAKAEPGRERFVVTESVFSMDGDVAPLREIADLCTRYGASLIVDEAHSTGCYGDTGSGCVDASGIRDRVLASVHTGGKALGVPGAYIAGSTLLKEYLTNRCRHLIFTTALPPECGRWWLEMLPKVQADSTGREALHAGAKLLRTELAAAGVPIIGSEFVVPVVMGEDGAAVRVAERVRERGFDVRAIRPPSVPPGTSRVRVSVHADHEPDVLRSLASAFAEAVRA